MSRKERTIVPIEQRIPFHKKKNVLITQLEKDTGSQLDDTFLELGRLLSKSRDLSNTQKQRLAFVIQGRGILTYCRENVERLYDDSVDDGWWDIENSGEAQSATLSITADLSCDDIDEAGFIQRLAALFNIGHGVGFERFENSYVINPQFSKGKYEDVEESVYASRAQICRNLVQLGLVASTQIDLIEQASVEEFHKLPCFECFLVAQSFPQMRLREDPTELFRKLQDVLYVGYGLAMREAPVMEDRLYGKSQW